MRLKKATFHSEKIDGNMGLECTNFGHFFIHFFQCLALEKKTYYY